MDLSYPPAVRESIDRVGQALADVSVKDELEACERDAELWNKRDTRKYELASSPLAQVAELRALGFYALPLPELLTKARRAYVPLPGKWSAGGAVALGWPDPSREERVGDAFVATFEGAQARVLTEGDEALKQWDTAAQWERLALIGLTAGLIDRTWRIALDALCEGKRQGHFLADEQVAQFQLADNDIERISAEHLVLDVAIDVEHGKRVEDKLALVRYFTSKQAEACAGRALHLAQLFTPRMVPIARWLIQRAHHLSVFGMAREHEVRIATAGLAAGMSLE